MRTIARIGVLVVALMSGVLSLARELLRMYRGDQVHPPSLFWDSVGAAFILAVITTVVMQQREVRTLKKAMAAANEVNLPRLRGEIKGIVSGPSPEGALVFMLVAVTNSGGDSAAVDYRARVVSGSETRILQPRAIVDGFTLKDAALRPMALWSAEDSLPDKSTRPIHRGELVSGPIRFTVMGRTPQELTDSRWVLEFKDVQANSYETPEVILDNKPIEFPYVPGSGTRFIPTRP